MNEAKGQAVVSIVGALVFHALDPLCESAARKKGQEKKREEQETKEKQEGKESRNE
jgi:hypothetical protein